MAVPPPPPLAFDRLEKKRLARRMQARSPGLRRAACGTVVVVVALARGPKTCDISGHLPSRVARAGDRRENHGARATSSRQRAPIHRPRNHDNRTHAFSSGHHRASRAHACVARAAASALGYSTGGYEYMVFWAHGSARLISMGS